jgi:hypothetical protein
MALAPLALAALLVALATLQYQWTGELGRAEEDRARIGLSRAAAGLAADFDRGLGRLFFHFLQPPASQDQIEESLAGRLKSWRQGPETPELLRQVFFASQSSDGRWSLRALDESSGRWQDATWPAELAPLGKQLASNGEHGA